MKQWGRWARGAALAACVLVGAAPALAQDKEALRKLAMEIPIADMHLHLYPSLTPQELQARMDRNNVRWAGGVGPTLPIVDAEPFARLLGKRYIAAGGQPEMTSVYLASGAGPLVDPEAVWFKTLLPQLQQAFEQKKIAGIGELILSNRMSHPMPAFRRKLPIDAPTVAALFALADQHKGFVQIHMEPDGDSMEQLGRLMTKHPGVPVILSHCMAIASASTVKAAMERHANLHCELSARSPVLLFLPHVQQYMVHTDSYLQPAWAQVIEALPDRFLVGTDLVSDQFSYDTAIRTVRTGLLANLTQATMEKVANGNARRLLALEP